MLAIFLLVFFYVVILEWKLYFWRKQIKQMNLVSKLGWVVLAFITFYSCKGTYPTKYDPQTTRIDDHIPSDESVEAIIMPYKESLDAKMQREIGVFAHAMSKKPPESELGNFMCDATQEFYNSMYGGAKSADFTIMNYGGIRVGYIAKGPVLVRNIFELMPFENEIVTLELTGEQVLEMFAVDASHNGKWQLSENVKLVVEDREVKLLEIDGAPVQPAKIYTVLTTDYVSNGGSGMKPLEKIEHKVTGLKLRDLLISYCEWKTDNGEEIQAPITGRVKVIENEKTN